MQQQFGVVFYSDFTGGLNNRQSRQDLALNESPDCLDVVFNARGGFAQRRGFRTTTTQSVLSGGYIGGQFSAGTEVLWGIDNVGKLWTWNGSTFTSVTTTSPADASRTVNGVAWGSKLYFANWLNTGVLLMRYWNGTAFTTLTNTANNNYTAPTGGNAPLARIVCDHQGHMFWADTVESSVRYRSRVRWSHPLQPEDFAAADYFDIDPDDETDQITALVPFKDSLLVFKRRAVYAIYGYDKDSFTVQRLATGAGVASLQCVSANAGVCYWWSVDGNVYAYNGRGIVPLGDRITNVVIDGTVVQGSELNRVAWIDNQLFVSLVKNAGGRVLFMYDPQVGKDGAWTKWSFEPTSMFWWRSATTINGMYMTLESKGGLFDMGNVVQAQDDVLGVTSSIAAYYRTAWFTEKDAGLRKKWRRPHITVACGDVATLNIDVYHDFIESNAVKQLTLPIVTTGSGNMVWDSSNWDAATWQGTDPSYEFQRIPSLGKSHAIQLKFTMTNHSTKWWIDSVTLPYYIKSYR